MRIIVVIILVAGVPMAIITVVSITVVILPVANPGNPENTS